MCIAPPRECAVLPEMRQLTNLTFETSPIEIAPPLSAVHGEPEDVLTKRWLPPGALITGDTGLPTWMGEAFDYAWAVDSLVWCAQDAKSKPTDCLDSND